MLNSFFGSAEMVMDHWNLIGSRCGPRDKNVANLWCLHQRPATSTWWCSPLPNGNGSKWQDRSPEGLDRKVAPIVSDCFSLGRSLTGHNWAAPLLDKTQTSLSWHCSLLVAMSTLNQAPSATILTSGTPAPSAIWIWAEILFNALLASSGCISFAPPLPVLTFAQSVQLAL